MADLSLRQKYVSRKSHLWAERSTWFPQWQELSRYLLPRNGRFMVTDRNRGEKRHNAIYDSTGTRALRVLAAGLMAGMTSPARPWFRLETADRELMQFEPVKIWVNNVTELMRQIFARSNTYRSLHSMYEELGAFGTGSTIILPDFDNVIHHYPLTIGEYAIATDHRGEVNTLYREFDLTVGQLVGQFGRDKVSTAAKSLFDKGSLDSWVSVTHVVEPRADREREARKPGARNMPIASCYYESQSQDSSFLRESGFKRYPGVSPRWAAVGGDIYGSSPGMESLGDLKQLQHQQLRKAQGIDYMVKPPVALPSGMKNVELNSLPGGANYFDGVGQGAIKNLFDVKLDLQHLLADIQDVRMRVEDTFYKNLFMMLAMDTRSGITAREVAERHEEKLLMLGPVLERLHTEMLKRKIDVTFDIMVEAGILPTPPAEMQGQELNVEFISMLAQAQRAIGIGSIDRLVQTIGTIATFQHNAGLSMTTLDKLDTDELVDKYSEMLGVDPTLIVADKEVAIVRKQRSDAQEAAAKQQQMAQAAQTAQTLAKAPTGGEQNALTDIIGNFSGYSGPGLPTAV